MQNVKKDKMKTIAFLLTCGSDKDTVKFNLERINKLNTEGTDFEEILVYFMIVDKKAFYISNRSFKEYLATLKNIKCKYVSGGCFGATPPRAYNYGLFYALKGPADYFVFLNDNDTIVDKNLLKYYEWLFKSAHNPDVVGAVSFSTNNAMGKPPSDLVKMFYADDVTLRGTCIKREAIITTGPFDELLITYGHEIDFFSRMTHHNGWLTRLGKEPNTFIEFSKEPISNDRKKLEFIKKQSLVWYARKWQNLGVWPDETETTNCYINKSMFLDKNEDRTIKTFLDLFVLTEEQIEKTRARLKVIYEDKTIIYAVRSSEAFIKKPIGKFTIHGILDKGVLIYNKKGILTHVECDLQYWKTLKWKPKEVY